MAPILKWAGNKPQLCPNWKKYLLSAGPRLLNLSRVPVSDDGDGLP